MAYDVVTLHLMCLIYTSYSHVNLEWYVYTIHFLCIMHLLAINRLVSSFNPMPNRLSLGV